MNKENCALKLVDEIIQSLYSTESVKYFTVLTSKNKHKCTKMSQIKTINIKKMQTVLCTAVGTASHQHGLEACPVCVW